MSDVTLVNCYNKGCGKKFDPNDNSSGSCTFHPGVPIFHDAMKGWSCCKKKSPDFTEFLNFPGCTDGNHSNVKVEPEKPAKDETSFKEEVLVQNPPVHKPLTSEEPVRPPSTDPMITLPLTVGASLKNALEMKMKQLNIEDQNKKDGDGTNSDEVKVGTNCHNKGCQKSYVDASSLTENCMYHPGCPIFHEGMKYWSCCKRKTSEFDMFLSQEGCECGTHRWQPREEDLRKAVTCRYDWHQTAGFVTISVFAKLANSEQTTIECNGVKTKMSISFEAGKNLFQQEFNLRGVIDPKKSTVKLLGTKVEVNLKKADAGSWASLELSQK